MKYVEPLFRPPSEARSFILQATLGCSWNYCTYCGMYREKPFRVRPKGEILEEIALAATLEPDIRKVFVADGDPLCMEMGLWEEILAACGRSLPRLSRVSCYATARNVLEKTPVELRRLREAGLTLLYIGPESGDDQTLKAIAKGANASDHVEAARLAHEAGMKISVIFLLGIAGTTGSEEGCDPPSLRHAVASAELATAMDPEFLSLLTVSPVPGTPFFRQVESGRVRLPGKRELLVELRTFIDHARPSGAIFRTNHASNYLPLSGRLARDRDRLLAMIDKALAGKLALRAEWMRGL